MTNSLACLLLLMVLCLTASAQTAPDSSGRVADEGPYKSQVRVLEDRAASEPGDDELLRSTAQNDYGRALVLRQLAQRGIATGDTAAAISHYEQALSLDSLSPLASAQMQINLGQLYALAGRHSEAIELLVAAMDNDDTPDAPLIMSLASAYLQNDQPANAARQAVRRSMPPVQARHWSGPSSSSMHCGKLASRPKRRNGNCRSSTQNRTNQVSGSNWPRYTRQPVNRLGPWQRYRRPP